MKSGRVSRNGTGEYRFRLRNLGHRPRARRVSRLADPSLMSWLAFSCSHFLLLNSTQRQFSFSFRTRFPRDLSVPPRLHNAPLQSGAIPSFRDQVARTSPVPCFADAVKHPKIRKQIIMFSTES